MKSKQQQLARSGVDTSSSLWTHGLTPKVAFQRSRTDWFLGGPQLTTTQNPLMSFHSRWPFLHAAAPIYRLQISFQSVLHAMRWIWLSLLPTKQVTSRGILGWIRLKDSRINSCLTTVSDERQGQNSKWCGSVSCSHEELAPNHCLAALLKNQQLLLSITDLAMCWVTLILQLLMRRQTKLMVGGTCTFRQLQQTSWTSSSTSDCSKPSVLTTLDAANCARPRN